MAERVTRFGNNRAHQRIGFENSVLHKRWKRSIIDGAADDFVICVTASSRTGVSGTGKTTFTTYLANQFDASADGFDATAKATLDAGDLAYDILPEVANRSAVIFDEAQGAPGTVGIDGRRAMKEEVIDSINAVLNNRDKSLTVLIVGQQLQMLDTRLYGLIDAWLLIRRGPKDPEGAMATHHKMHVNDYNLRDPTIKTPGIEDVVWPHIPHDHPDYKELDKQKQDAKTIDNLSDGESLIPDSLAEMQNKTRDKIIKELHGLGVDRNLLAEAADVTPGRISQIANSEIEANQEKEDENE